MRKPKLKNKKKPNITKYISIAIWNILIITSVILAILVIKANILPLKY